MSTDPPAGAPAPAALPPASTAAAHEGDDTVLRGAWFSFAARFGGGLLTGGLTVFLAHRLGSTGYGVFALALSFETLLFLLSDYGVIQAAPRFVAENRHDRRRMGEYVGDAIRLKIVGVMLISVALFLLAGVIAHAYNSPKLTWTLRGISLSLIGMNFLLLCDSFFTALRRQGLTLRSFFFESCVEVGASVALVLIASGPVAAAFGRAIGYLAGGAMALFLVVRLLGPDATRQFARANRHLREIASDASALLVVDGAYSLFATIDSLLIGAFLTVTSVGIWQAPLRLIVLLVYPAQGISSAVVPRMVSSRTHPAEPEVFAGAMRVLIVLMAAVTAVTTVWADPIIRIALGSSFHHSAAVLRALAPYVFLSGIGPLVSVGMNYLGAARSRIPIAVSTVVVNVILDVILIPRIGVLGGAIGTDVAFLIYVPAHFLYCQRALAVPLGAMGRTLVCALLAGGAMAAVLAVFGTGHVPVVNLVAGAILGLAAFAAVLAATGEATPSSLRALWRAVRRRSPAG